MKKIYINKINKINQVNMIQKPEKLDYLKNTFEILSDKLLLKRF